MPRRYFIQHMGGDPIRILYVKFESYDPETGAVEWTEHPSERHEWDMSSEAHTVRTALKMGVCLPTSQPDERDIDAEARRNDRRQQPEPPPSDPLRDSDLPWWQR